jgi:hypothetical protein
MQILSMAWGIFGLKKPLFTSMYHVLFMRKVGNAYLSNYLFSIKRFLSWVGVWLKW